MQIQISREECHRTETKDAGIVLHRKRRKQSGMMLVTMVGLITCLVILMSGVALLSSNLIRGTRIRTDKASSASMADAGLDLGLAWIQSQVYPPDNTQTAALANFWGATKDAKGRAVLNAPFGRAGTTLVIGIYPDNANPSATQKRYLIESRATMSSGVSTVARIYARQGSFGKYAYFVDSMDDGLHFTFANHFDGLYHANNSSTGPTGANIPNPESEFVWMSPPPDGRPIFEHDGAIALETVLPVSWRRNSYNNVERPDTATEWADVVKGGSVAVSSDPSNYVPLPKTTYEQMYIALDIPVPTGALARPTLPTGTKPGVNVSADGGIFIRGDNRIALSGATAGVQKFTIVTNPSGTTTLTQTVTADATSIRVTSVLSNTSTSAVIVTADYPDVLVSKPPKGLLFSDGEIKSLSGTVADNVVNSSGTITYRNQWSIITDTTDGSASGKDVLITDSVKYATQRTGTNSLNDANFKLRAGTLGIVANDIKVATVTKTPSGATTPLRIDVQADLFCTGSWQAEDPTAASVAKTNTHTVTNIGGIIVNNPKAMRNGTNGRIGQYNYDQRLADNPPPYFPTISNRYKVTSYQIVTSTLE